jgi:hypothetical protein
VDQHSYPIQVHKFEEPREKQKNEEELKRLETGMAWRKEVERRLVKRVLKEKNADKNAKNINSVSTPMNRDRRLKFLNLSKPTAKNLKEGAAHADDEEKSDKAALDSSDADEEKYEEKYEGDTYQAETSERYDADPKEGFYLKERDSNERDSNERASNEHDSIEDDFEEMISDGASTVELTNQRGHIGVDGTVETVSDGKKRSKHYHAPSKIRFSLLPQEKDMGRGNNNIINSHINKTLFTVLLKLN